MNTDRAKWIEKGYKTASFNRAEMLENTKKSPEWVHFGVGNIFRAFICAGAQKMLDAGAIKTGIVAIEGYDYEIADVLDSNCSVLVTLKADGNAEKTVIESISEILKADTEDKDFEEIKRIFASPSLKLATFTITEKGYNLKNAGGEYFDDVKNDFELGEKNPKSYMGKLTALLLHRFKNGAYPLALVSMDNCSHNGDRLFDAVMDFARHREKDNSGFCEYIKDKVSFPWTMIDKITPRPDPKIEKMLENDGLKNIAPVRTKKDTFIAPFVNAEECEYLVIEDSFPNGRPDFSAAGFILTDRETVEKTEKMKVCTCLNPLHTALAIFGCLMGYTLIAKEMENPYLKKLCEKIGYDEGLPVCTNPKILSPKDFLNDCITRRISNPYMPDTPQRIATDTSQKVGIRYGETIKSYVSKYGDAKKLKAIPLAIAGWCRYLLGVDDNGEKFERSSDPMLCELTDILEGIEVGKPETYTGQLKTILSNKNIFGSDLYEAGIGNLIEEMFKKEIAEPGAVRKTLKEYL